MESIPTLFGNASKISDFDEIRRTILQATQQLEASGSDSEINLWTGELSKLTKGTDEYNTVNNELTKVIRDRQPLAWKQATDAANLYANFIEGLSERFNDLKNRDPQAILKLREVGEKSLWCEKNKLLAENIILENQYYIDADLLALQRRNKLLQFERDIFEIRQQLNEKSVFSAPEAQAKILDHINRNTKSATDIFADSFISAFDKISSYSDKMLDKAGIGKVPIIGDIPKAQGRNALGNLAQSALGNMFPDLAKDLEKTGNPQLNEARTQTKKSDQIERNTRGGGFVPNTSTRPRTVQDVIKTVTGGGSSGGLFSGANSSNPMIYNANSGGRFGDEINVEGMLGNGRDGADGGSNLDRIKGGFGSLFGAKKNLLPGDMSKGAGIGSGLGSLAMLAGGAIGGKWGNALSMAGMDAQIGSNFGVWGAAIGGGIGLIKALFGGNSTKKIKEASRSQYQISLDDSTAKEVQKIGQAFFGKNIAGRESEVVSLEPSCDLILSYAKRSGQSALGIEKAFYGDESWSGNQFRGKFSGFVRGGYTGRSGLSDVAGLVHREEYVLDANTTKALGVGNLDALRENIQSGMPSGNQSSGAYVARLEKQLEVSTMVNSQLTEAVEKLLARITTQTAGEILVLGSKEKPNAIGEGYENYLERDGSASERFFRRTGLQITKRACRNDKPFFDERNLFTISSFQFKLFKRALMLQKPVGVRESLLFITTLRYSSSAVILPVDDALGAY